MEYQNKSFGYLFLKTVSCHLFLLLSEITLKEHALLTKNKRSSKKTREMRRCCYIAVFMGSIRSIEYAFIILSSTKSCAQRCVRSLQITVGEGERRLFRTFPNNWRLIPVGSRALRYMLWSGDQTLLSGSVTLLSNEVNLNGSLHSF